MKNTGCVLVALMLMGAVSAMGQAQYRSLYEAASHGVLADVTRHLQQALALVDVRLLDHFVVGDGPATSMAARGWM